MSDRRSLQVIIRALRDSNVPIAPFTGIKPWDIMKRVKD